MRGVDEKGRVVAVGALEDGRPCFQRITAVYYKEKRKWLQFGHFDNHQSPQQQSAIR